jgi:hypothetical protein
MTVESWLKVVIADAEARGLPQLKAMLETLALSTKRLRDMDEALRAGVERDGR